VTWFIWAWFFLELCRQQSSRLAIIGVLASLYLEVTSGFPQASIAISILVVSYIYESIKTRSWKASFNIAAPSVVSLLLASPALLPAIFSLSETARDTTVSNNGLLSPTFGDYMQLGSPLFIPKMAFWNPEMHVPIFYLAWFIPLLIPFIHYPRALSLAKKQRPAFISIIVIMLLGTGPESLGPLRYPFRFIPFLHILIGAISFVVLFQSGPLVVTRNRIRISISIIALTTIAALLEQPNMWRSTLITGMGLSFMLGLSIRLYLSRGHAGMQAGLLAGTLAFFTSTHISVPRNIDVADWAAPAHRTDFGQIINEGFSGYSLYIGDNLPYRSKNGIFYFTGTASGIWSGRYTFNGYTTLGRKQLQHDLCLEIRTQTLCPAGVKKWTEVDRFSNTSLLDLFKVNDIVVQNGDWREELMGTLGNEWSLVEKFDIADELTRKLPSKLPGTLSWHSDGITVDTHGSILQDHESISIKINHNGGRLIFARVFWPGYFATLNELPLNVLAHNNSLLAVDLPPNATGQLHIRYRPPGLLLGLSLAGIGLVIISLYLIKHDKINYISDKIKANRSC
jgi:hypothetical protein